jgi:hypothetical protein
MCNCDNIRFGTFGQPNNNRTAVRTSLGLLQEIDNCILDELRDLWKQGILTEASCCGHNKTFGSIIVREDCIDSMLRRNYVQYTDRKDTFYPKSIPITNKF